MVIIYYLEKFRPRDDHSLDFILFSFFPFATLNVIFRSYDSFSFFTLVIFFPFLNLNSTSEKNRLEKMSSKADYLKKYLEPEKKKKKKKVKSKGFSRIRARLTRPRTGPHQTRLFDSRFGLSVES